MLYPYSVDPVLIIAAVVPAAALMVFVYRADRLDKEPTALLWRLILQGVIATALATFAERIGASVLSRILNPESAVYQAVFCFLVVGLSEEGFKYLLLKRFTWNSPHFNCRFDGVVYAVFVSLGFALWENISYVALYGIQTALVRALTAVPGHASFGVFMGAWYGLAKSHERHGHTKYSLLCRRLAVFCPVLLHGLYDLIAMLSEIPSWIFIIFIALLFLAAFTMTRSISRKDQYI